MKDLNITSRDNKAQTLKLKNQPPIGFNIAINCTIIISQTRQQVIKVPFIPLRVLKTKLDFRITKNLNRFKLSFPLRTLFLVSEGLMYVT